MTGEEWRFTEGEPIDDGLSTMRLLGGGERYETYLAYDERRLALVAVKVVRPDLTTDAVARRGLAREAELLVRLSHPAIVRSFGAVLDGPRPYLLLEHLEGPRLSSLVRRHGPLDLEQLAPLGVQLASAAHYMAAEGVVHLDIKPSNVIMGAPARLIDLSIARTADLLPGRVRPIGTDAYMAPEQCDPVGRGPLTPAADVWGLGATLHHAALGRATFAAATDRQDEAAPAPAPSAARFPQLIRPPEPLPSRLPGALAEVVTRCLAADPGDRPTAAEVAAAFEGLAAALPRRPVLRRFRVRPR